MNEKSEKQILTNSSLTTFRTCPRKFELRYEKGYVPAEEKETLFFGKLFHAGLEAWGKANPKNAISIAVLAVNEITAKSPEPNEFLRVIAVALLEGYNRRYQNDEFETVEVEKEFRAPLLNPDTSAESKTFMLGGVMDGIIRKAGRLYIKETKTTSEDIAPDADYWQRLLMDSQVSGYYVGAEACGISVESCIYDVVKKPTLRPYKATPMEKRQYKKDGTLYANQRDRDESPDKYYNRISADIFANPDNYFARREVPRSETDLADYYFDVYNTSQQLRACQLKEKFPRYTHSCMSFYGPCAYWKFCSGQTSIENPNEFKKVENVHQELKQVA